MFKMLLELSLLSFAMAEETAMISDSGNAWGYGSGGGLLGFILLVLDIIVFVEVLKSNRPPSHKLLWCVLVFLFPIGGLILYWLFSDRAAHSGGGQYESLP